MGLGALGFLMYWGLPLGHHASFAAGVAPPAAPFVRALVPSGPPPQILPLSQVRPGMVGVAYTVFTGTKPEPFNVRVVSIVENFIPKQDIILVKAEDPRVEFSGIAAGMSGSPVYIDGKLIGAIAYGWSFSKLPLAGVTPIEAMLGERKRPRRVFDEALADAGARAPSAWPSRPGSADDAASSLHQAALATSDRGAASGQPHLQAVSVPLSVSGMSAASLNDLTDDLRPFGLVPMRAGGSGRRVPSDQPGRVEPGGVVGVQLIRGDMNATALGTVTYVSGDTLLAFGHPMFGAGEVSLPMVSGEIHTFIPSLSTSFKLGAPLVEIGTVVQDRQSCIIGDLTRQASMVPVNVRVTAPDVPSRLFETEIARSRRLTPLLASMVISSAITDAEPDPTEVALTIATTLKMRGRPPIEIRDHMFSGEGLSARALSVSRGVRAFGDLLQNPFAPVIIDSVAVDVRIQFRRDLSEIIGVSLPGDTVRAGDTVPLRVTLRPYAGPEYTETVPVTISRLAAGKVIKIDVASGALVRPDVARPESLGGYIESLRTFYTPASIIVSVSTPDSGASLRGRLIPGLPLAALDTLQSGNQTRRADAYRMSERTVFPSSRMVTGRQELTLYVRQDALGHNR